MPIKFCSVCGSEYFGRWRNTPAICEECTPRVTVCAHCSTVQLTADDPTQLALFSPAVMARVGVWWSVAALVDHHFATRPAYDSETLTVPPWPRRATQAEQQRSPYH